jgi:hypothetical protein
MNIHLCIKRFQFVPHREHPLGTLVSFLNETISVYCNINNTMHIPVNTAGLNADCLVSNLDGVYSNH